MKLKEYDKAIEAFAKQHQAKLDYAEAYANLGAVKEMKHDIDGAIEAWKKAADLGYKDAVQY